MIIELRVFNKAQKKMVYLPPLVAGGFQVIADMATREGFAMDDPIMIKTPIVDKNNVFLWEGDIVSCAVISQYGLVREKGVVVWRPDLNQFTINIARGYNGMDQMNLTDVEKIGDIHNSEVEYKELIESYAKRQ